MTQSINVSANTRTIEVRDNRGGNWWWAHNAILDHYVANTLITPGEAMVYFALCRISANGHCAKSIADIARLAGAKDRFTRSAIQKLAALELIQVEARKDERGSLPNAYAVLPPPVLRTPPPAPEESNPLSSVPVPPVVSADLNKKNVKDVTQEETAKPKRRRTSDDRAPKLSPRFFELQDKFRHNELTEDERKEFGRFPMGRAEMQLRTRR